MPIVLGLKAPFFLQNSLVSRHSFQRFSGLTNFRRVQQWVVSVDTDVEENQLVSAYVVGAGQAAITV